MTIDCSLSNRIGSQPSIDQRLAELAASQWGIVSTADLLACGLTHREIHVRVRRGQLHRLHRGVYVVGHLNVTVEGRFLAPVKACGPEAARSDYAAACLWCLLQWDGRRIDVTAPTYRKHQGIRTHRSQAIESVVHRGIPVTPRVRTVVDLARTEDEKTVTRALRQAKFSERELAQLPTGGMIGRILNLSAAPASPEHCLPAPEGRPPAPPRSTPPAGQVDGRGQASCAPAARRCGRAEASPRGRAGTADRKARLEAEGWRVLRVTLAQARQHPQLTIARLRAAGAPR